MKKYGKNESGDILADLNSLKVDRQKDAVKKVISAMTTGRDVSKLFPQIVKCILTKDLELKKLIYLYIINYARIKPVETLLAVNAFKKDSSDINNNPLTRALAVRTMGCLGVEQIMQFLCDPLKDALNDKDPYVRKTGALCVAKIYDINSQLCEEQFGFIDKIQNMIEEESNAMVIANCISALIEISTTKGQDIININWKKCSHLMKALHENNEWTQMYLLEGISRFQPKKQDEINEIIEKVLPCTSHSNSGVVLAAIKILVKLLDLVENPDVIRNVCKKLTPSLVTLLSSEPEIQYVALKNINILIQKRPIIFEKDIKMFFCTFTEPLYNKIQKLEILYKLVSMNNIDMVLNELREYAGDVDIQFVKRSVKLVSQCAIKLEKAAQRCVETLVELVKTRISFVIQEAIIGLRDIFRRYPNTFEGAMAIVNENLRTLDEPEAKAALIWIIGEYSDRIDGAEAQLTKFIDNIKEEPYIVQLQILNSATKTFLKCQSEESYNILNSVFDYCTKDCELPDIREKGFIYYRLMSISPEMASKIIVTDKPKISEDVSGYDEVLLDKLLDNLGTLASIYSKPPELFVKKTKKKFFEEEEEGEYEESTFNVAGDDDKKDTGKKEEEPPKKSDNQPPEENNNKQPTSAEILANKNRDAISLLDIDSIFGGGDNNNQQPQQQPMENQQQMPSQPSNSADDLLGIFGGGQPQQQQMPNQMGQSQQMPNQMNQSSMMMQNSTNAKVPPMVVLADSATGVQNQNSGLEILANVNRVQYSIMMTLTLTNKSNTPISNLILQFNKNLLGLSIDPNCLSGLMIQPGDRIEKTVELQMGEIDKTKLPTNQPPYTLQTGLRCSLNEYYFFIPVIFFVCFEPQNDIMSIENYQNMFMQVQNSNDNGLVINNLNGKYRNVDAIIQRLNENGLYTVNRSQNQNGDTQLMLYSKTRDGVTIFVGVMYGNGNSCNVMCKCDFTPYVQLTLHALQFLLTFD